MAARFDCKKLLRFALATLCLLALAMFMPVAARAEGDPTETKSWTFKKDDTTYLDVARNGGTDQAYNVGTAKLRVHVWQPGTFIELEEKDFYYHYNSKKDDDLSAKLNENYASDDTSENKKAFGKLHDKGGKGDGGYGSVDLVLTAANGYKIYAVEYTVCHSSGGPSNTGWRDDTNNTKEATGGIPTQNYYLDNVTDKTTVDIYLMQEYTVKYQVSYNNQIVENPGDYLENYKAENANAYPNGPAATVRECEFLNGITEEKLVNDNSLYGYHRWCDRENEPKDAPDASAKFTAGYTVATTVTVPTLTAKKGYTVSGWKVNENKTVGFGDTVNMSDLAQYANENRVIILTAVVTADKPENTDNSGNNNGNGDNGGNNGGDNNNGGNNNNNGGNNGNNGGQESTPTPAPETTPAPTASVTTVTAVAPTATPTATPAPTAEPTATPAPAAVSAHIPQTSDDMPYTLLVVTALASLCAAGALFMKRRSK